MTFSERYGYKPIRQTIQIDSIDEPLKNGLWSLLKVHAWDHAYYSSGMYGGYYLSSNKDLKALCDLLWFNYFKKPLDKLDNNWSRDLEELRQYFFACKWNEVYDFIEFVANNYKRYQFKDQFIKACNYLLQKEVSAPLSLEY